MRSILLLPVILLSLPPILSAQTRTETAEAPTIRVSGTGIASANPDLLQMQVAVVTRDSSAQRAAADNATVVASVLSALRSQLGVGSSVTTVSYSVEPQYYYPDQGGDPLFAGYIARNTLRVETADLSKAGAIVDAAVAAGANNIGAVSFTLREQAKLRSEALAAAARDARAKAEALAAATGARVGQVRTIDETARLGPMPQFDAQAMNAGTELLAGPVEVHADVIVVYDLVR